MCFINELPKVWTYRMMKHRYQLKKHGFKQHDISRVSQENPMLYSCYNIKINHNLSYSYTLSLFITCTTVKV